MSLLCFGRSHTSRGCHVSALWFSQSYWSILILCSSDLSCILVASTTNTTEKNSFSCFDSKDKNSLLWHTIKENIKITHKYLQKYIIITMKIYFICFFHIFFWFVDSFFKIQRLSCGWSDMCLMVLYVSYLVTLIIRFFFLHWESSEVTDCILLISNKIPSFVVAKFTSISPISWGAVPILHKSRVWERLWRNCNKTCYSRHVVCHWAFTSLF